MERLNIPLRRTRKTTRHTRRVVWILTIVVTLTLILGIYLLSTIWFTRDTLSHVRPVDTVATIRLLPTEKNAEIIQQHLNSSPIITKRGIKISDILPSVRGELALYLRKDGSHIVGLRSDREHLPGDLLDANEIVVQNPKPGVFLLSNTLVATQKASRPHRFHVPIHWLSEEYVGTMTLHGEDGELTGHIAATMDTMTVRFPKQTIPQVNTIKLSEAEYAGLSTPLLTNSITPTTFRDIALHFTNTLGGISPETIMRRMQRGGEVYLGKRGEDETFLLVMNRGDLKTTSIKNTLKTVASLRNPSTKTTILPDDSSIEEIIANPDDVDLETETISGTRFLKTPRTTQRALLGGEWNDKILFSNDKQLLDRWVTSKENADARQNIYATIKPKTLLAVLKQHSGSYDVFPFYHALNTDSIITIENSLFYTNITKE